MNEEKILVFRGVFESDLQERINFLKKAGVRCTYVPREEYGKVYDVYGNKEDMKKKDVQATLRSFYLPRVYAKETRRTLYWKDKLEYEMNKLLQRLSFFHPKRR